MTIIAEDLESADSKIRAVGALGGTMREGHASICRMAGVDEEACAMYINHTTEMLARHRPMSNDDKTMVATAIRHAFAVGILVGRGDQTDA